MYSAKEAAEITGLSTATLRYYEREKLLPKIARSSSKYRQYTDEDIEWIKMIQCMRMAKELGIKLKNITFSAAYTSDMLRAEQTAKLILSTKGNDDIKIQKDMRLREWCLGSMDAEHNTTFIQMVSDWLGGVTSFAELNRRLPDVAMAIYEHDTTGMAEPFTDIANRLNSVLVDIAHNKSLKENSNILVVTHAFAIKTFLYLFAPEKLCTMDKLKNATILKLLYDGKSFFFEKTDFE